MTGIQVTQVLIDADSMRVLPLQQLVDELAKLTGVRIVAAGNPALVGAIDWPPAAEVVKASGWQRADITLAERYENSDTALVLVSGDKDFSMLVQQHRGPVLVVSQRPAGRYRDLASIVNPYVAGPGAVVDWLAAVDGTLTDTP